MVFLYNPDLCCAFSRFGFWHERKSNGRTRGSKEVNGEPGVELGLSGNDWGWLNLTAVEPGTEKSIVNLAQQLLNFVGCTDIINIWCTHTYTDIYMYIWILFDIYSVFAIFYTSHVMYICNHCNKIFRNLRTFLLIINQKKIEVPKIESLRI